MRARGSHRGVTPIIATVFLVAITVVAGAALWTFRIQPPPQPAQFSYLVTNGPGEPTWGDGSDCSNIKNATGVTYQTCWTLPTVNIILTSSSVPVIPLSELNFYLLCNGSVYLTAPLSAMTWVPGTPATVGGNAPQLGVCGTYVPPAAAWNRLGFYEQANPGSSTWRQADEIVLYAHSFQSPNCPNPGTKNGVFVCDDDFHGAPEWCYTIQGACSVLLVYTGSPSSTALRVPLFGLST